MLEIQYNKKVEVIRIVAILGIVLYHIACMFNSEVSILKIFSFISLRQWFWVDVFLVLSGYYFYKSFTGKFENKFIPYIKNRFVRIVPAYYLFLLIYLTAGLKLENLAGNNFSMPSPLYWIHFFSFTVNYPLAFGKWTGIALEGFFGICILVQFYILFAFLFSLFQKQSQRFYIIIVFQILALVLRNLHFFQQDIWISYFFTFTRIDALLWGMLLYILLTNSKSRLIMKKFRIPLFFISISVSLILTRYTYFFSVENLNSLKLGFPFLILAIISFLNLINIDSDTGGSFYAGDFVFGIYLVRLPLIYLIKSIVMNLNVNPDLENYFFIFLSFTACILWGVLFNLLMKRVKTIRHKQVLISYE